MKKVILSALAVVFAFNIASAQEEVVRVTTVTTTNYFKPNQGDVTADLGIEVWNQTSITDNKKDNTKDVTTKGPGTFYVGGKLLFGADYYIAQSLYVGAEAGLDLGCNFTGRSTTIAGGTTTTTEPQGSEFNLGTGVYAGFKIGFVF